MRHRVPSLLLVLAAGALAACASAKLEVPAELAQHKLNVQRQGRQLAFGEFVVQAGRPHSRISKQSWGHFLMEEQVRASHLFGFGLVVDGKLVDEVACERDSRQTSHENGVVQFVRSTHTLRCVLSAPDGRFRGELSMKGKRTVHDLRGELTRSAVTLELTPSDHPWHDGTMGDAFAPAGYEIRTGGVQIGAVQTLDGKAVWIDPRAPTWLRKYVALAAGVLLIHTAIHQTVDIADATAP
jgi:hypothetical protein